MAGSKKSAAATVVAVAAEEIVPQGEDGDKKRVMNAVPADFVKQVKEAIPESIKLSQKDLKTVCEAFVKTLVLQVKDGNTVSFTNNMTFKRVVRDDRTHKNPKTGEEVFKPAHYVMTMEVKPMLKRQFEEVKVDKAPPKKGGGSSGGEEEDGTVEDVTEQ